MSNGAATQTGAIDMVAETWKTKLEDEMPSELAREIDMFEQQMALRRQGNLDEKIFAEARLRRGAYGQRYDNGQRHDGTMTRQLEYPSADTTFLSPAARAA